jgi:hypothetical protein
VGEIDILCHLQAKQKSKNGTRPTISNAPKHPPSVNINTEKNFSGTGSDSGKTNADPIYRKSICTMYTGYAA